MDTATLNRRSIGRWLAAWAIVVFALVIVGGATRLTESGLSITEWKPVSGILPPMSDSAWVEEFLKYKKIPQYSQMNAGMTMREFEKIFLWEYFHRLLARLGGLVFALPFFWFWLKKKIPRETMPSVVTIGVLTIGQAALGWYMVASGLTERINVSQYRLAAHLSLALVIYLMTVWTADSLLDNKREVTGHGQPVTDTGKSALQLLLALASFTVVTGAFVAGLRAGKIYNEFPMMGAGLVPMEYGTLSPWWRDFFENPATAQFHHRVLAMITLFAVAGAWFRARRGATDRLRMRLNLVLGATLIQVALGLVTLLMGVPVIAGIAHQAGALLLLTALTLALGEASRRGARRQ